MHYTDLVKKISIWVFHIFVWILLNIMLGSLPFIITLLRSRSSDPFLIGLLCFCFTVASSGLYIFLINSQRGGQSGLAKTTNTMMIAFTVVWIITVWTIVLQLPNILPLITVDIIKKGSLLLYICSIVLFFCANYKSLSEIVNSHVSRQLIAGRVSSSKADGSQMKATLDMEGDF